jgi:hypothetical protein
MAVISTNIITEVANMGAGGTACAQALNEINTTFAGLGIDSSSDATLGSLTIPTLSIGALTVTGSLTASGVNAFSSIGTAAPGAAGGYFAQTYKITGIADNTATSVVSFSIPAGNQAAAFRVLLCATMSGSTDDFESSRVATGTGIINRKSGEDAAAAVSAIAQAQIATSGDGTITLAYSITTPAAGAGFSTCDLQVTIVKTGTVTNHECVVFIELINSQGSGITCGSP